MRPITLKILFLFLTTRLFSQVVDENSLRIIYAQYDSIDKVQVIPSNALSGGFDLLIIGFEYDKVKIIDKRAIEISWSSAYIDGRYVLIITPKQIYLRSSHDNPNPNNLYWMTDINQTQYDLIKSYLSAQNSKILKDVTIDKSYRQSYFYDNYTLEKYVNKDWKNKRYENYSKLIKIINKPLEIDNKISIPNKDAFMRIHPLRLVFGLEELDSQIKIIK
jgi:hypothetical protein